MHNLPSDSESDKNSQSQDTENLETYYSESDKKTNSKATDSEHEHDDSISQQSEGEKSAKSSENPRPKTCQGKEEPSNNQEIEEEEIPPLEKIEVAETEEKQPEYDEYLTELD